ncbi:MAG: hypothetical protein WA823_10480 [Candidatus Acidiferrales bacterium]
MPTAKAKKGTQKSAAVKKGKALKTVKPLTEMSIPYTKVEWSYKTQ